MRRAATAVLAVAAALVAGPAACTPRDRILLPSRHCPDGTDFEGTDLLHACVQAGVGLTGPYRGWWPGGSLRVTAEHRVGAAEGLMRWYEEPATEAEEQGAIRVEAEFVSGQREGRFTAWPPEPDGGRVEGQLLQGVVVGRWRWLGADGSVRSEATYDRNVCVAGDCGRDAGRLPAPFVDPVAGLPECGRAGAPLPPPPTVPPSRCGPGGPWKASLVIDPVGLPTQVVLDEGPAAEEARECLTEAVRSVQFPPPPSVAPCRRTFVLDPAREAAPLRAP